MPLGADYYVIPRTIYSSINPTINHDITKGIENEQFWMNTTTKDIYQCKDNSAGAAQWYVCVFQLDPLVATVPDYQSSIEYAVGQKNVLITPEVIYNAEPSIGYDLTIPEGSSSLSVGPVTIEDTFTVTVSGTWTII